MREVAGSGSKSNKEDEEEVEKAMGQMCGLGDGEDDADSLELVRSKSAQFLGFCCLMMMMRRRTKDDFLGRGQRICT
ncbi:uncharacterized protein A4U43_C08F15090 [Asparagus officinalis]|nr:uncharacterized protein A4U43_C08F15090 [Asparagus officinalis]